MLYGLTIHNHIKNAAGQARQGSVGIYTPSIPAATIETITHYQ